MRKIIILDGYTINPNPEQLKLFQAFGDVTVYDRTPNSLAATRIADAEYIFTDITYIGKEVMDQCTNLKWIGILATGLNSVDVSYAKTRNITVCNVPAYGSEYVAQHAFALLLHACNRLKYYGDYVTQGKWADGTHVPFWDFPIVALSGKTMGIVGFGPIGRCSAKIAQAFGMNVLISTNYPDPSLESETLQFVHREELFSRADVISLHCPLTKNNERLISESTLSQMKDGVILVNTARGKLIDEMALSNALNRDKVTYAALDVLADEPPQKDNPLLSAKNCFITPHSAWAVNEARSRICEIASNNLKEFLDGRYVNCVTSF